MNSNQKPINPDEVKSKIVKFNKLCVAANVNPNLIYSSTCKGIRAVVSAYVSEGITHKNFMTQVAVFSDVKPELKLTPNLDPDVREAQINRAVVILTYGE